MGIRKKYMKSAKCYIHVYNASLKQSRICKYYTLYDGLTDIFMYPSEVIIIDLIYIALKLLQT